MAHLLLIDGFVILTPGRCISAWWVLFFLVRGRPYSRGVRAAFFIMLPSIWGCAPAVCLISSEVMPRSALGLIETTGLNGAIKATAAATRAAKVDIASAERIGPNRIAVKIEGDWDVVQAAVEAGAQAAEKVGELVSMHVIPRPEGGASDLLPYKAFLDRYSSPEAKSKPASARPKPARSVPKRVPQRTMPVEAAPAKSQEREVPLKPVAATPAPTRPATESQYASSDRPSLSDLERLPVVKLRRIARGLSDLPIQGRQISMANKQQLLEAIKTLNEYQP